MKKIALTQGKYALVDDEDFEQLSIHKWLVIRKKNGFYAARKVGGRKNSRTLYMHRHLLGADVGEQVDHADGNGLNNQRSNIRVCSKAENMRNRGAQKNNKSGFKGVSWNKESRKWIAHICTNKKQKHLGYFPTKHAAAKAYNAAASLQHGGFSKLNDV